jgi:phosphoenolpyruvate carboxykinase (GTP)
MEVVTVTVYEGPVQLSEPAAPVTGELPASPAVHPWLAECVALCRPHHVHVLDGSPREKRILLNQAVDEGVFLRLNQDKLPDCYLHRSHPNDVARTEHCTYICTRSEHLAGPTNNWMPPNDAYALLRGLFSNCMRGRTMYVVPFLMGPAGSPLSRVGVEVTDSIYVALSMGIMTRMGQVAWRQLGESGDFTRCLHALGDLDPERRYICHFPEDNTVWSFGSGYGGNALLGKKCLALRLASYLGFQQGWMAEHMMLVGVTDPQGEKTYIAGAFPSACGKTNLAMLVPPEKYRRAGWKITTVGDDIVWMYIKPEDGRLYAINPEAGHFGVLPGTNTCTNPNAMKMISYGTLYTNVALLPDGGVWWEGKTKEPPAECLDWTGQPWTPGCGRSAAHPNSRFTTPIVNNPVLDPAVDDPQGVPVSGIVFGGRRSETVPLIFQAFDWIHGVYLGATLGSATTAAAVGPLGAVRRDPMAMVPFCGYNINLYFTHWIRMRKRMVDCPRIFHVNWFRSDARGRYLWAGFGENMRILEWIINRCRGRAYAAETSLGWMPRPGDIDLEGLDINPEQFAAVQAIDVEALKREIRTHDELFLKLAGELPKELILQRELLSARL